MQMILTSRIGRFTVGIVVAAVVFAGLTVAVVSFPGLRFAHPSTSLHTAIESLSILITLGAFYLCFSRFIITRELRLLALSLAFIVLGLSNLSHVIVNATSAGRLAETPDLPMYLWLISRLASATLVLWSLRLKGRLVSVRTGWQSLIAIIAAGLFVNGALYLGQTHLPPLLTPAGWELVRTNAILPSVLPEVTTVGLAFQSVVALIFAAATVGYLRAYMTEKRPFWGWLSLSLLGSFFTQVHFLIYPSIYSSYVYTGDILRLFSRVALFLGTYSEVGHFYRSLETRNRELGALHRISDLAIEAQDAKRVLEEITSAIASLLQAEKVALLIYDPARRELICQEPASGLSREEIARLRCPVDSNSVAAEVFRTGKLVVRCGPCGHGQSGSRLMKSLRAHSLAVVPLKTPDRITGVIEVVNKRQGSFDEEDTRLLGILASRAAMVIENARLHDQLEAGAILDERARMARELHDGLAQNLGYLQMKLAKIISYAKTRPEKAREDLLKLSDVLDASLVEARQAITDMGAATGSGPWGETIVEYAYDFSRNHNLAVDVTFKGPAPQLGERVQSELMRIVQEALHNARKHSSSRSAHITVSTANGFMEVTIADNGKGFDLPDAMQSAGIRHFGLANMRERSVRCGGSLEIKTKPGTGTVIKISLPLQTKEELSVP